ncbi:hypothetical protein H257_12669 [Aphanomyces astaci]|uniref:Uncharacterized protein n=1 Tax=Aphanomyces astaci TaxID=112090 RepID=W4FZJ4_APHAT|nr:hypothetical protein, variant [Aphanomyces astaci]XP_009838262.1 hypothetical protein H257_12669 [Aphanomyces astaci]ETV72193.1 hypothetical protein H257_12669 [Aphanomyces astaci]ETV72194.1 hypothetical protein, variant [Aphanomyces astaci]|eukprot:XP_009838261.1 hypothetical protein, variant [Aphanomyces astaci]
MWDDAPESMRTWPWKSKVWKTTASCWASSESSVSIAVNVHPPSSCGGFVFLHRLAGCFVPAFQFPLADIAPSVASTHLIGLLPCCQRAFAIVVAPWVGCCLGLGAVSPLGVSQGESATVACRGAGPPPWRRGQRNHSHGASAGRSRIVPGTVGGEAVNPCFGFVMLRAHLASTYVLASAKYCC